MRASFIKMTGGGGTGAQTLSAVSGFPSITDRFGSSGTVLCEYCIQESDGDGQFEAGYGSIALSTGVLTRTTPKETWNGTTYDVTTPSAVNFGASCVIIISPRPGSFLGAVPAFNTTDSTDDLWPPGNYTGTNSGVTLTANRGYTQPYLFIHDAEIGTCGLRVSTAAAGTAYAGLYDWGTDGRPGPLLIDFGSFDVGATGNKTTTSVSWTPAVKALLSPGWYWMFLCASSAPTLRSVGAGMQAQGLGASMGYTTQQYGPMAAAGAPNATWTSNFNGGQTEDNSQIPLVALGP